MPEARYDAVADFYATAFNAIDNPAGAALLNLVGSPAGLRILDLACGHGRITRELARRGADVTGADISAALIGKARQAEKGTPARPAVRARRRLLAGLARQPGRCRLRRGDLSLRPVRHR